MKTAEQIAEEIVTEITTGGTIAFAGLGHSPTLHEMERAIVLRAIKSYRAEHSPLLINPDEAQELADRFREAAEGDSGDSEISAACDMAEYLESLAAEARKATMSMTPADLATLASAAAHWATELTDYIIDGSLTAGDLDSAESQTQERDEIQAALARYLGSEKGI